MSSARGVVFHFTGEDPSDWEAALRRLTNLHRDDAVATRPETISLVVLGPAVRFLTEGAPGADRVRRLAAAGVSVVACGNSLDRLGPGAGSLIEGVEVVGAGVSEVVRLQDGGNAYIKLP